MLISEHSATIDACRFCFMCRHVCTLGVVTGKESDTPRGKGLILFKALKGHIDYSQDLTETLYRCCLCGVCQAWCQAGCTPPAAVLAARADVVSQGKEPDRVRKIQENVSATGNPFGRPADERFKSIQTGGLLGQRAEVLYYVGCDTAYLRPEIANAMIALLRAARADLSLLPDERSTGKPLWLLGYRDQAKAAAERLLKSIRAAGCRQLVTACPSAFDAFVNDYPAMGLDLSGIEVLHASQYLDRLAQENRLPLAQPAKSSMTLLDSSYLGRYHGVLDEPRRLLGRIPQARLLEMVWSGKLAYACGESGGVFRLLHPDLSVSLAERVLAEAASVGAELLVTTCPASKTALLEANRAGLPIRDLVEVLAESVGKVPAA